MTHDPACRQPWPTTGNRAEELVDDQELIGYLRNGVALLPERHRMVVVGFFFEGRSVTEIGGLLGVTQSRASQIKDEALKMLREGLRQAYADPRAGPSMPPRPPDRTATAGLRPERWPPPSPWETAPTRRGLSPPPRGGSARRPPGGATTARVALRPAHSPPLAVWLAGVDTGVRPTARWVARPTGLMNAHEVPSLRP